MKVFVINLARRPERMRYIDGQLANAGVAYERVEAVDGACLSEAERKSAANGFRWWCARGYMPRAGEIGCALSHRKVWRAMIDGDDAACCVMEDDVALSDGFVDMLRKVEVFMVKAVLPVVVLLTPRCAESRDEVVDGCFGRVAWAALTGGYVLNREAARRLLFATERLDSPIDEWSRWARRGSIALYAARPSVCSQAEYGSEEWGSVFASDTRDRTTVLVRDMSLPRKIVHKALRVIGKAIDEVLS